MKSFFIKIILFSGFLLSMSCGGGAIAPYWEISDPRLPVIAMARRVRTSASVVIYNPETCQQIGDACRFFRLDAFAHDRLNHTILARPVDYPASMEAQADCWVAKYGKPNEVHAAVQLFLEEDSSAKWKIHGDPNQRAQRVRVCAIEAGNWIGNGQDSNLITKLIKWFWLNDRLRWIVAV